MEFPQYRKYFNGKSYFKILSETEFIEVQIIGSKAEKIHVKTDQFPERVRISDMINCLNGTWVSIEETEFESLV